MLSKIIHLDSIIQWIILVSMQTIVELQEFQRKASSLLSEAEKQGVINYLAAHPQTGIVLEGTGGIRKFRWASGNKGKSGGVRVIYYFYNESNLFFFYQCLAKKRKLIFLNQKGMS